jgi:apolipoprotein N-acyltransferase
MPFIKKLVAQVGDFHAGEMGQVLAADGYRLGVLICYEIIFPELTRAAANSGATLLANLTNDAWYGRTAAPYQHFSMAVFRAVESRRALVRAANTGISGFIDPAGRRVGTTPLFSTTMTTRKVPLMEGKTIYMGRGHLFPAGCLVLSAIGGLLLLILRRRGSKRE